MNDNAIIFSYDTRVSFWVFWSIIGFCVVLLLMYILLRYSKMRKPELCGVLLAVYVCAFLLLAVFLREPPVYPDGFTKTLLGDKSELVVDVTRESIFNILIFIPIGVLLYNLFSKNKFVLTTFWGLMFSLLTEMIQYILNKGVPDIDDVICNVEGLLIGAILCLLLNKLQSNIR